MSYPITDYTKGLFLSKNNYRQTIDITVYGLDETFALSESDIIQGGLNIVRKSSTANKLQLGAAISSTLTLNLNNADGRFNAKRFEGAELYLNLGILKTDARQWENATKQYVPLVYFTVDSRPAKYATITLSCLDRMAQFDKNYDSSLAFPATLKQILLDACTNCSVPISSSIDVDSLPNITYSVAAKQEQTN